MKYKEQKVYAKFFTCPHCGVLAKQDWNSASLQLDKFTHSEKNVLKTSTCQNCNKSTIWLDNKLYYPDFGNAPTPNPQMPEKVKNIYLEASSIWTKSPRGSAALLRLGLQVLFKELGEKGNNLNKDIGNLVSKGLPKAVQQSLDIVRVTGNEAVHPGQIDTDDKDVVGHLFELTNIITEYMISMPQKVNKIYSDLPQEKLKGINDRDKK